MLKKNSESFLKNKLEQQVNLRPGSKTPQIVNACILSFIGEHEQNTVKNCSFILLKLFVFYGIRWNSHDFNKSPMCEYFSCSFHYMQGGHIVTKCHRILFFNIKIFFFAIYKLTFYNSRKFYVKLFAKISYMSKGEFENYLHLRDRHIKGDSKALAILYFEAFDALYNYGIKFTSNKEIVEDSIQNLFVDLLSNKYKLENVINVKLYIFKSLKYIILKELSLNNKLQDNFDLSNASFLISPPVEKSIINKEEQETRAHLLSKVYNGLGKKEKEAVYLKYNCGFDYPELSSILEISIESARTLVYRAIKKIRKSFEPTSQMNIVYRQKISG